MDSGLDPVKHLTLQEDEKNLENVPGPEPSEAQPQPEIPTKNGKA